MEKEEEQGAPSRPCVPQCSLASREAWPRGEPRGLSLARPVSRTGFPACSLGDGGASQPPCLGVLFLQTPVWAAVGPRGGTAGSVLRPRPGGDKRLRCAGCRPCGPLGAAPPSPASACFLGCLPYRLCGSRGQGCCLSGRPAASLVQRRTRYKHKMNTSGCESRSWGSRCSHSCRNI